MSSIGFPLTNDLPATEYKAPQFLFDKENIAIYLLQPLSETKRCRTDAPLGTTTWELEPFSSLFLKDVGFFQGFLQLFRENSGLCARINKKETTGPSSISHVRFRVHYLYIFYILYSTAFEPSPYFFRLPPPFVIELQLPMTLDVCITYSLFPRMCRGESEEIEFRAQHTR